MEGKMQRDPLIEQQIDEWLRMWHAWASSDRVGQGYPSRAAGCDSFRASRQYDDSNGALGLAADIAEAEAVEAVVKTMTADCRHALALQAKNLCVKVKVWKSPRLSAEELALAAMEGRARLWDGMVKKGLA